MPSPKSIILTTAKEEFVRIYHNTTNCDLMAKYDISKSTIVRVAKQFGLKKDKEFRGQIIKEIRLKEKDKPKKEESFSMFDRKIEFAKSLGYNCVSKAYIGIGRFEFELMFKKKENEKTNY